MDKDFFISKAWEKIINKTIKEPAIFFIVVQKNYK